MGGKPRQAFATANLVDHVRKSALCRTGCHWAARWAVRLRTDLPISMRPSRGAAAQAVAHHLGGHSPAVSIVPASATPRTTLGRTNAIPDRRDFTMAKQRPIRAAIDAAGDAPGARPAQRVQFSW